MASIVLNKYGTKPLYNYCRLVKADISILSGYQLTAVVHKSEGVNCPLL
jgi:hypothetical protein